MTNHDCPSDAVEGGLKGSGGVVGNSGTIGTGVDVGVSGNVDSEEKDSAVGGL
jgi:hypothetical protein